MPHYFTYIFHQLVGPFVIMVGCLTGVVWLTQSLRFIDLIVNKGLGMGLFFYLTILLLPSLLAIILPIAVFAAAVYAYHRLIADSEITVLRASGLSNLQIGAPAIALAAVVAIVGYLFNLALMPAGYRAFKDLQTEIRDSYVSVLVQEGVFNTPIDGLTIYVRRRTRDGELLGILVHDARDTDKPVTLMAERGRMTQTEEGPNFVLHNGNRQEINLEDDRLSLLYFDRYAFTVGGLAENASTRFREAKERYLHELISPDDTSDERHLREFMAEAHMRLASPLHGFVFVLIALAALLSGEFNRRGNAVRILVAVGAAIAFQASAFGVFSLLVKAPSAAGLAYGLIAVAGVVAFYFLVANPVRRVPPDRTPHASMAD